MTTPNYNEIDQMSPD
jgi:hypothetical protein